MFHQLINHFLKTNFLIFNREILIKISKVQAINNHNLRPMLDRRQLIVIPKIKKISITAYLKYFSILQDIKLNFLK